MNTSQTCGQGLAENSTLPAKLAELTAAVARILENHRKTLDLTDEISRKEDEVYADLAERHRAAVAELQGIAGRMAAARDLPMGRHDRKAAQSPEAVDALAKLIEGEEELRAYLQKRLETDRAMLEAMA